MLGVFPQTVAAITDGQTATATDNTQNGQKDGQAGMWPNVC